MPGIHSCAEGHHQVSTPSEVVLQVPAPGESRNETNPGIFWLWEETEHQVGTPKVKDVNTNCGTLRKRHFTSRGVIPPQQKEFGGNEKTQVVRSCWSHVPPSPTCCAYLLLSVTAPQRPALSLLQLRAPHRSSDGRGRTWSGRNPTGPGCAPR